MAGMLVFWDVGMMLVYDLPDLHGLFHSYFPLTRPLFAGDMKKENLVNLKLIL